MKQEDRLSKLIREVNAIEVDYDTLADRRFQDEMQELERVHRHERWLYAIIILWFVIFLGAWPAMLWWMSRG